MIRRTTPPCSEDAQPLGIVQPTTEADVARARDLIVEYAGTLGIDLAFQGFDEEIAGFPGEYGSDRGRLFLATIGGDAIGCIALRPLSGDTCELKRLYVRPQGRKSGIGRALMRAAMGAARDLGYRRIRLDTLSTMTAAIALYLDFGFRAIPPYRPNPVAGACFFECDLEGRTPT
jgi:ribosomal protein S18 acetylase RimI-like enzyme